LGATQLGLVFGKKTAFCGAECVVENEEKHEVDHEIEKFE